MLTNATVKKKKEIFDPNNRDMDDLNWSKQEMWDVEFYISSYTIAMDSYISHI